MNRTGVTASEYKAPWGGLLKITSAVSTLLFLSASALLMSKSHSTGWSVMVAWLLPLVLFSTIPFLVRGYRVRDSALYIDRLFWATEIPLENLRSVEVVPNAMKGGLRLCGNGGMFSFTGWWWNRRLGHYRPYVTDMPRTVVLKFDRRTIVISPEHPELFAQDLQPYVQRSTVL